MFSLFQRQQRDVVGIDLGTSAIKVVELVRSENGLELKNYGEAGAKEYQATIKEALEAVGAHSGPSSDASSKGLSGELQAKGSLEAEGVAGGSNRGAPAADLSLPRADRGSGASQKAPRGSSEPRTMEDQIAELLDRLLEEAKVATRDAVLSIPVFASFSTTLTFPATMREEELAKAVPYEAKSHVPLPLPEVELDWVALPGSGAKGDSHEVLIVAVPKETIEKYRRIAAAAGIELRAFEVETFSLVRSVAAQEKNALLVDIGTSATSLAVVEDGFVRMSHGTELAGGEFSRAIVKGLRIGMERAEELKRQEGIVGRGSAGVRNVLVPFVDRLAAESERLIGLYERKSNRAVEKVILSGGSSRLPGLAEHLSAKLTRPTVLGEAFKNIRYPQALEPMVPELNASFAVAVGLAMRELT